MTLRSISIDELDHFKLDEHGRLYWKGEAVILEKRLVLERYQVFLAIIGAAGAMLSGIHPFGVSLGLW